MKISKEKVIINFIAIVIAALFLVFPLIDTDKKEQYDIVFLGDSIIGNAREDHSIPLIIEEKLGMTVFNGAFGGSTLSFDEQMLWGSVTSSQWCMAKLADAIVYQDWQGQLASMNYADYYSKVNKQALNYFEKRMNELSKIDFEKVEVLIIEHGTNDYNCGRTLDNPQAPYDITTFGGALRYSLRMLQEKYPNMQIVLMTPLYCEIGADEMEPCYLLDFGSGTLDAYVQLEKQIAEEFDVVCIDAYNDSGIWEHNADEYLYDGLHLTEEGIAIIGDFIANKMLEAGIE